MLHDIKGVVISIIFVVLILILSELIRKLGKFSTEFTRKLVHIGVSHWWLIAMFLINDLVYAIIPPILFIILNYYSYKKDLIKSMERGQDKSDLGTVYFPVSLLVLILLTWNGGLLGADLKHLGALGILVMGYGDGFAALIGEKFGRLKFKIFSTVKSIEGSIAMFVFSFAVSTVILGIFAGFDFNTIRIGFALAIVATLIEAYTPYGLDNLTVPILITLVAYYLLENDSLFFTAYLAAMGFALSFLIAYGAYLKQSLTTGGAAGATIIGTIIYATTGFYGFSTMILFFLTSSALSHFKRSKKAAVALRFHKTGRRDILQVFANGGIGMIHSVLFYLTNNPVFLVLLGISFAAASADTWATELGILNKKNPISLRTFRPVAKGTSGAVSFFGTFSSLVGSVVIALFVSLMLALTYNEQLGFNYLNIFLLVSLGGFIGSTIDSILGATVQGIYYSDELKGETEKSEYNGKPTKLIRGFKFVDNDLVNFLSIALASIVLFGLI